MTHYGAIVVGSGITGGFAGKELTEKGLETLVLEAGRSIRPEHDYVEHVQPWDLHYRGLRNRLELDENKPVQQHCYACDEARTRETFEVTARVLFLCASALESTRLLLNSATEQFPDGLANSSGVVGRNLMDQRLQPIPRHPELVRHRRRLHDVVVVRQPVPDLHGVDRTCVRLRVSSNRFGTHLRRHRPSARGREAENAETRRKQSKSVRHAFRTAPFRPHVSSSTSSTSPR